MIHHPTVTVTAAIEADTPEQALEFLQHRVETSAEMAGRVWGTPDATPLFTETAASPTFPGYPNEVTNRILWNVRGGDIDEIVISNCTVHVEQMNDRCWWIGVTRADGGYWAGNFVAKSRGPMTFTEQERWGFDWDRDDAHNEPRGTG